MATPHFLGGEVSRADITAGLRQIADYLDAHPDLPAAPYGWDLLVATHGDTDTEAAAEVDRIAAILGVPVDDQTRDGGHYTANKTFGPITYRAFHITARSKAAHRAHMTYADAVTPEDPGELEDPPQAA